jgi:type IV pilus assembly protein PilB
LRDLGIEDYMISSSLHCVVAQRLLRRLCGFCRQPDTSPGEWSGIPRTKLFVSSGSGCPHCRGTGYIGRQAVAEVLVVTDEIRQMIDLGKSAYEVVVHAKQHGFVSLSQAARKIVLAGITDIYEYDRVIGFAEPSDEEVEAIETTEDSSAPDEQATVLVSRPS